MYTPLPDDAPKVPNWTFKQESGKTQGQKKTRYACAIQAAEECVSRRQDNPRFFADKSKSKSGCPGCRNLVLDARQHVEEDIRICRKGRGSTEYIQESDEVKWTSVNGIKAPPHRLLADDVQLRWLDKEREKSAASLGIGELIASGDHDKVAQLRKTRQRLNKKRTKCYKERSLQYFSCLSATTTGIENGEAATLRETAIIPEHLIGTLSSGTKLNENLGGALRLYQGYLPFLYIGKSTAELNSDGEWDFPVKLKEIVASINDSKRKTFLLDTNRGPVSKRSLSYLSLAAPKTIPKNHVGVLVTREITEDQGEAFKLEAKLINSVQTLKNNLGPPGRRVVTINEQKEILGGTAKDEEGNSDVSYLAVS